MMYTYAPDVLIILFFFTTTTKHHKNITSTTLPLSPYLQWPEVAGSPSSSSTAHISTS
jgi:hypothetical protein